MIEAHDVDTVRAAEGRLMATLPPGTLMQRAATGLAAAVCDVLEGAYGRRVVLLVGSGDNGGDALHAGARLARRGARVDAVLLEPGREPSAGHRAGLAALRAAGGRVAADDRVDGAAGTLLAAADAVVDGILGIGGRGGLRGPAAALAELAGQVGGVVVAADLPSGVDASSGEVPGPTVRADLTVTFGAPKPALLVDPAAARAGVVRCVDIGLAPHLPAPGLRALDDGDVAALVPRPDVDSDKYARGVLGVDAGSDAYTGAAVLCVGAAVRGGAGMVRFAGDPGAATAVRAAWPEAVLGSGRVQAWVVGPGWGDAPDRADRLRAALDDGVPLVLDADGLRHAALASGRADVLLTPHAGELARLLGVDRAAVAARRLAHLRQAVERFGTTVLLKGSTTLVAGPDAGVWVCTTGTAWLATAGSGDVLSGLAGALLAGGLPAATAGTVAAHLHGVAGRLAADGAPTSAGRLVSALPAAWRAVAGPGPAARDGGPASGAGLGTLAP